MSWHLFVLVWGDEFVDRFRRLVVPFLAMPGNIPALAADSPTQFHVYTDEASRRSIEDALAPLSAYCEIDIRLFNDSEASRFSGPDFRYELQRGCLRDLGRSLKHGSLVLLDSNFILSDGSLRTLAARRRAGFEAACATFVRVDTETILPALESILEENALVDGRALLSASLEALHHITRSFFVDSGNFTPYPSQVSWWVGSDGFVTRNFLPHPLMIPVSPLLQYSQSTMDYDLALRIVSDDKIWVVNDSDEVLIVKFSGRDHHVERDGALSPNAKELGLFLLTCTNRRHRLFANRAAVFHRGGHDPRFDGAIERSRLLVNDAYEWIDWMANRSGKLDARFLMYLKSHIGPIEDFMSPQLEPAALARLL